MKKEFNIVLTGVGGQGVLTLAGILARIAVDKGFDVKASELHGLAMRFGSLDAHLRIGENLSSPLVSFGKADLIIAHEPLEALRAARYCGRDSIIIFDTKKQVPILSYIQKTAYPSLEEIKGKLGKFSKQVIAVDASLETEKITGFTIIANAYLLGRIASENILPFKKPDFVECLASLVPKQALSDNLKLFELGFASKK